LGMTVSFLNNVRSKWRTAAVWMGHVGASTASSSSGNTLVWDVSTIIKLSIVKKIG
jgi:hypothetical protein